MSQHFPIYTKTGDNGTTGLGNGERRDKTDIRIEAIGTIDELNASLGVVIAELPGDMPSIAALKKIQHALFGIGSSLALVTGHAPGEDDIAWLEKRIDSTDRQLQALTHFILPGGSRAGAEMHRARTICRRAERVLLHLARQETVNLLIGIYLNRLSDLLFVMARDINQQQRETEERWMTT